MKLKYLPELIRFVLNKNSIHYGIAPSRQNINLSFRNFRCTMPNAGSGPCVSKFKNVSHCIFDIDGLLIDTESIFEIIRQKVAKQYNKNYSSETRFKLIGLPDKLSAEVFVNETGIPITADEYLVIFRKMSTEMMVDVKLMDGAERLVRHLHENKVPLALATNSSRNFVDVKFQKHKALFNLFSHMICVTDPEVKQGKPAPDVYLIAAARFCDKPPPECCLVFEDSPTGLMAAHKAGMQCVMVPSEDIPLEKTTLATQVLKSLADFNPNDFGLPTYRV